jgi:hypothetical protein
MSALYSGVGCAHGPPLPPLGGKTIYSDQPCGSAAQTIPNQRPRFLAGERLQVSASVVPSVQR